MQLTPRVLKLGIGAFAAVSVVLTLIVGAVVFAWFVLFGQPSYSFENTLPKMVDRYGPDARVVSIDVHQREIAYRVISGGRTYAVHYDVDTSHEGTGTQYSKKERVSDRPVSRAERAAAKVTLGQLDAGVVDRLFEATGAGALSVRAARLVGTTWRWKSGVWDEYRARYDGSGIVRTRSKRDVFG